MNPDSPTSEELEAFSELVSACQLEALHLIRGESTVSPRVFADSEGFEKVEYGIDVDTSGATTEDSQFLVCLVKIEWAAVVDSEESPIAKVSAQYMARYRLLVEVDPEPGTVENFARHNGLFNVWSFFREYLQSMTSRMGLPPATLPLLKPVSD